MVTVNRKNWTPSEHAWLCSVHFVSGKKSDNQLSPDYIPTVFDFMHSPVKRNAEGVLMAFKRRKQACVKCKETATRMNAAVTVARKP